jgi:hypothetical protein
MKKAPPERGSNDGKSVPLRFGLDSRDVRRLQTFRALDHIERDGLSLRERAEPLRLDFTEMHEEIFTLRLFDETVALLGTKPLDSPLSQPCNLHLFRGDAVPGPTPL